MIKFIDNIGDFFSSNYFDEDFVKRFHGYLNEADSHIKSSNKGKLTGVTINKRLKEFKYVVGEAKRARIIDFHPFGDMKFYTRGKTPKSSFREWLTPDEFLTMMKNPIPYPSTVKFFNFSCNSSIPFAECYNMKWSQVRDYGLNSSEIRLIRQKTQKEFIIQITPQAREILGVRGKEDEKVFDISGNVDDINKLRNGCALKAFQPSKVTLFFCCKTILKIQI